MEEKKETPPPRVVFLTLKEKLESAPAGVQTVLIRNVHWSSESLKRGERIEELKSFLLDRAPLHVRIEKITLTTQPHRVFVKAHSTASAKSIMERCDGVTFNGSPIHIVWARTISPPPPPPPPPTAEEAPPPPQPTTTTTTKPSSSAAAAPFHSQATISSDIVHLSVEQKYERLRAALTTAIYIMYQNMRVNYQDIRFVFSSTESPTVPNLMFLKGTAYAAGPRRYKVCESILPHWKDMTAAFFVPEKEEEEEQP